MATLVGFTNRGMYRILGVILRAETPPTNFYVALVTDATAPGPDINTLSDLTEIAAGNGYTSGGYSLNRNSTDFDTWTEDDTNDEALMQVKDVAWTASGGAIPGSGDGARYAVLLDDDGTVANREVWAYWDLGSARSVSNGQTLTLQDLELNLATNITEA